MPDDLDWGVLTAEGLTVHPVPGNHFSALRSPHIEILARQIQNYLPGEGGRSDRKCRLNLNISRRASVNYGIKRSVEFI